MLPQAGAEISEADRPTLQGRQLLGVGDAVDLQPLRVEQGDRAALVRELDVLPREIDPRRLAGGGSDGLGTTTASWPGIAAPVESSVWNDCDWKARKKASQRFSSAKWRKRPPSCQTPLSC
jgi:hypothetical protein